MKNECVRSSSMIFFFSHHKERVCSDIKPSKDFRHSGLPGDDSVAGFGGSHHTPDGETPEDDNRKETGKGVEAHLRAARKLNHHFAHVELLMVMHLFFKGAGPARRSARVLFDEIGFVGAVALAIVGDFNLLGVFRFDFRHDDGYAGGG